MMNDLFLDKEQKDKIRATATRAKALADSDAWPSEMKALIKELATVITLLLGRIINMEVAIRDAARDQGGEHDQH